MPTSLAKRIEQLRHDLEKHNRLYYIENKPVISDQEYDALMKELMDLEKAHPEFASADSPSHRVGGDVIEGFTSVAHAVPMMSIDNTYDEAEVRAFDQRVHKALEGEKVRYVLEPKVDGIASSLRYEDGLLVLAATRGDGKRGDDITTNARTIANIPLRVSGAPKVLEVRGEIYMNHADFARMNKQREEAGQELFANPRNATGGTLKQLDPKIVAKRRLRFVAHGLGQVEPLAVDCYWDWIKFLEKLGFPVGEDVSRASTIEEVIRTIEEFEKKRAKLPFLTDGMVVKVDNFAQREKLGARSKAPRWVIAYKYQPDQVATRLLGVRWQVGKLGTLTPVADMEPVLVAGTTVQHASLHNIEQIERLDVRIGDTVIIEKAGEVIPQVVKVVIEERPRGTKKIEIPTHCPSCGAKTEKEEDTPYVVCINPACPTQLKNRLRAFCARGQMNIEGLGESLIDQLVDGGFLKTFADIYRLKKEDLLRLERMGDKSAQNVITSIENARDRGLDRLLAGLGIRHIGNRVSGILAQHFGSLSALLQARQEDLLAVHEIGDAIAESAFEFFHNAAGKKAVAELIEVGIDPKMKPAPKAENLPFAGQSIVVTGTLETYTRPEIEELIAKLGGRASGSVSRKTAFVVAGKEAGSKLEKAKELKVPVLSEAEFREKIQSFI